jgi:hypothetical protein
MLLALVEKYAGQGNGNPGFTSVVRGNKIATKPVALHGFNGQKEASRLSPLKKHRNLLRANPDRMSVEDLALKYAIGRRTF